MKINDRYYNKSWIPDPSQIEAIEAQDSYHFVMSPPGCGKTQILTERIRYAHDKGIKYTDMFCVTFTNRAARVIRERIRSILGDKGAEEVYVGNVHRYCSRFLYKHAVVPAGSSMLDDNDAIGVITQYTNEDEHAIIANPGRRRMYAEIIQLAGLMHQIIHKHPRHLRIHPECVKPNDILAMRSICKAHRMTFDAKAMIDIFENTDFYLDAAKEGVYDFKTRQIIELFLRKMSLAYRYKSDKRANNLLDFEDLLLLTYDAMRSDSIGKYKRYPWVQVDEVQDLNPLQLAIIDAITAPEGATTVYLGDEQQAIYSFMGAKTETLNDLKERCAGHVHYLNVNHRSPAYLLEVFNHYAEKVLNIDRNLLPTTTYAPKKSGNELRLIECDTIETEMQEVANLASRFSQNDKETTAIIVTSNREADAMSKVLDGHNLPHFKVSGTDLFSSDEVKLLLAHLNVLANEDNLIAWVRLFKGLKVFETTTASRNFIRALSDRAILPTDFLIYDNSTYVQDFYEEYENREIVIFDTETTGLNIFEDDILQIAAVTLRHGQIVEGSEFNIFIATQRKIPRKLGDIENPIIEEMRHNTLHDPADALQQFINYVGRRPLIGHNADYDYNILIHNLERYLPHIDLRQQCPKYFDSLKLIRLLEPHLHEYKLKTLLTILNLEGENSHLADADVHATCSLVVYCHRKAAKIIDSQQQFISHKRVQEHISILRKRYANRYLQTRRNLYLRNAEPSLTNQLNEFYEYLLAEKYIEKFDNLPRIINYLNHDMIDPCTTPSLYEQFTAHIIDINSLRESDICGSSSMTDRLFIVTLHKAKGMEFHNVIVVNAVDGCYPTRSHIATPMAIIEDSRKFYVGLSRARKRLYITYSSISIEGNRPQARFLTRFMQPILHYFQQLPILRRSGKNIFLKS